MMKRLLLILCLLAFTGVSAQISQTFKNVTINDSLKSAADSVILVKAHLIPTSDSSFYIGNDSLPWEGAFIDSAYINQTLRIKNIDNAPTNSGALIITGGSTIDAAIFSTVANNNINLSPSLTFYRARGTVSAPTVPIGGAYLGRMDFGGWDGAAWEPNAGGWYMMADGTFSGSAMPAHMAWFTSDYNGSSYFMYLTRKGTLSLNGSNVDTVYTLTVNGSAMVATTPFASRTDSLLSKDGSTDQITATPYEQWVYQPIDSLQTNLDALTLDSAMYTRIGNLVTVSGVATVDPTAGAATSFYLSIPVSSNMASPFVAGSIHAGTLRDGGTVTFGTTQKVFIQFLTATTTSRTMTYTFTYRIQ